VSALFALAAQAEDQPGVAQSADISSAARVLLQAAEKGDATAQNDLGVAYEAGNGVPKNIGKAIKWFRKSAEQGNAVAQYNLAAKYSNGEGVAQDPKESLKWFRLAAAQGYGRALYNIAVAYINGQAVARNYVLAAAYFDLAAGTLAPEDAPKAVANRDRIVANLTSAQVKQMHDMVQGCQSSHYKQCPGLTDTPADHDAGATLVVGMPGTMSTGSAFFVNGDGYLVTDAHVVSTCKTVSAPGIGSLERVAVDSQTDLAILKASAKSTNFARLRDSANRPGEAVVAVGFPYSSALRSGATVTTGVIAALSGLHDDLRFMQMTAPVQHGNSGGPLLGPAGTLVGVVDAALIPNDLTKMTNDIPQNINFAVAVSTLRAFLEANHVVYDKGHGDSGKSVPDIAEDAMKYTILIECAA